MGLLYLFVRALITFLFLFPAGLLAQVTITGKVLNSVNREPVPNASVFLSNTAVGCTTMPDGTFTLSGVKGGKYGLVVSCVGYEAATQNVSVYNSKIQLPDIQLIVKMTELREVKIRVDIKKPDARRAWLLRMFTEEFFGRTPNAAQCKLLNPDALDIQYGDKAQKLTATSAGEFLVVENKALGYYIKYLLSAFIKDPFNNLLHYTGATVFEPMKGTARQETDWKKNRVKAYLGSPMHFLRSCIENNVGQNDFTVFRLTRTPNADRPSDSLILQKIRLFTNSGEQDSLTNWSKVYEEPRYAYDVPKIKLNTREYIKLTNEPGLYAMWYPGILMVNYKNNNHTLNDDSTFIIFGGDEEAFFDSNGTILSMRNSKFERYWSGLRVADQLPVDYELPRSLR